MAWENEVHVLYEFSDVLSSWLIKHRTKFKLTAERWRLIDNIFYNTEKKPIRKQGYKFLMCNQKYTKKSVAYS